MFKLSVPIFAILALFIMAGSVFAQGPWIMEWYALDPIQNSGASTDAVKKDWLKDLFGKSEADMSVRAPDPAIKGKQNVPAVPGEDGSVAYAAGTYTIKAGGADIWGTADAFRYTYISMSGDFDIAMKAESLTKGVNDWSKIGPMVRQNNKPGSQYLYMLARALDGNKYFQERMTEGGSATGDAAKQLTDATGFPIWLKITRKGNDYTGSVSADGKTWKDLGKTTLALKDPVLVGIAVTSHLTRTLVTGVASNLTITGKEPAFNTMKSEDIGTVAAVPAKTNEFAWAVRNLTNTADSNNLSKGIYASKYGADLNNFVFYGMVGVTSTKAQDTVLNLAQDDDARVWLNGKQVIESIGWTGGATTTKPFAVSLKKGMNLMMVKVAEGSGGDYLNARFDATDLTFTPKGGAFDFAASVSPAGKLAKTWGDIKSH